MMPRKLVQRDTLERLIAEFPVVPWGPAELDDLVASRQVAISGFASYLLELERLAAHDLGTLGPAGPLQYRRTLQ